MMDAYTVSQSQNNIMEISEENALKSTNREFGSQTCLITFLMA